jgi:hypothetical protein
LSVGMPPLYLIVRSFALLFFSFLFFCFFTYLQDGFSTYSYFHTEHGIQSEHNVHRSELS